ncbi:MAG TPA: hypothetical protein VGP72_05260 [Planctomycetota bacterium]|jgi:hypothetical protein
MKHAPRKIFEDFQTPEALQTIGPIIAASWRIPQLLENALTLAGKPIPAPVYGDILVDTGAQATCISLDVSQQLGLRPLGVCHGYGAGGKHTNPIFAAKLEIVMEENGRKRTVSLDQRFQAIPHLDDYYQQIQVMRRGTRVHLIGLLGRDMLQHGRLQYDGRGHITLEFFPNTMPRLQPVLLQPATPPPATPAIQPQQAPPAVPQPGLQKP